MSKVLILGGTGAMGKPLIKELKKGKNQLTVTSRRAMISTDCVRYIQGNAKNLAFVEKLCEEHWDAIVDFMAYSTDEFKERIDVLLAATDQYIFTSSARVFADFPDALITEETPRLLDVCKDQEYLATDEYALAKARQENLLFAYPRKNWTIIRPSLTYNSHRIQLGVYEKENWLYRALKGRSIVFSKDLMDKYYTMTDGNDVAKAIAAIVCNPQTYGEAYNLVQAEALQWKEILEIYVQTLQEITGKKSKVKFTEKCTNLNVPGAKYQVIYGRYFSRRFNNEKLRQIVDVDSWVSPREGLKKALIEFCESPIFDKINWDKEVQIDRAVGEFTPIWEIGGKRAKLRYFKKRFCK